MSLFELLSSLFSYIFITIIYLFIFSVIRLIYMDIRQLSANNYVLPEPPPELDEAEDDEEDDGGEYFGILRLIEAEENVEDLSDVYILDRESVIIGRGNKGGCDIEINDDSMSSRHLELTFDGARWYARDLGSSNGTYVNGNDIGDKYRKLKDGDEISIGGVTFVIEM